MHPLFAKFNLLNKEIIIGTFGLLVVVSFILSFILVLILAKKKNYDVSDTFDNLLLILSGGILSALITGLFYTDNILKINSSYSPTLISWGGFLGGIIVVIILKLRWKIEIFKLLDLIIPGYTLALAIGRVGCFFGGCCYGKHTDSSWGVYYINKIAPASNSVQPLIPVQLISSFVLVIITVILIYSLFKSKIPGNTFVLFLFLYSIKRFSIEFFRDDNRHFLFGLSDGQCYAILLFAAGMTLVFRNKIIAAIKSKF